MAKNRSQWTERTPTLTASTDTDQLDNHPSSPSKSQRKRDMHALQALGEHLLTLNERQLQRLALPDPLLDAIHACRALREREALRRQRQYIGRLMRDIDAAALRDVLAALDYEQVRTIKEN